MTTTTVPTSESSSDLGVNWWAVAGICVFYLLVLAVGIFAGRKKNNNGSSHAETVMLGGRNVGWFIGICTMTATWLSGSALNGTAEKVFANGILSCQVPFGYATALVIGGFLFAEKMRAANYVTMLDPFQKKYGRKMGGNCCFF